MPVIYPDQISRYRATTFCYQPGLKLKTPEEAVAFVNQRGFISFWPIKGVALPSLWGAVAGDRPVPDEHDDPGHITWDWKDNLLGKKRWYYGRCIRKRNTMISLALLPSFYALSPNYGEPEQDYLIEYDQGLMAADTKQVYETLLREGPLDSINLRKAARVTVESQFNKALENLQVAFRVLPVGVSDNGAWHYSFVYDCTHRHFTNLIDEARFISDEQARATIVSAYIDSVGAASLKEIEKVLQWQKPHIETTCTALVNSGRALMVRVLDQSGDWIASIRLPGLE